MKKSTCNNRNPEPPCKEGYVVKKNPKNEDCCYKVDKQKQEQKPKPKPKTPENKTTCNNRNPAPPCKEGYKAKRNAKNEECCYKMTNKELAENSKPTKPPSSPKPPQQKPPSSPPNLTNKCNARNPAPPCKEGYKVKKNAKNVECCYKMTAKELKEQAEAEKREMDQFTIQNEGNNTNQNIDKQLTHYKHITPKHDVNPSSWALPNQSAFASWLTNTFVGYRKFADKNVESEVTAEQLYLFPHQRFVRDYLQYKSPYRGLLVYHGLGVGKSCTSIAAAEMLMNHKKVIVMLPASLRTNYKNEILKCGNHYYNKDAHHWVFVPEGSVHYVSEKLTKKMGGVWVIDETKTPNYRNLVPEHRESVDAQIADVLKHNYEFMNYNGINEKYIKENLLGKKYFDNKVVVIDEAHNFISGVSNGSKIVSALYKMLMNASGVKIILLTGTPIINKPHEIAYAINLVKGYERLHTLEMDSVNESVIKEIMDSFPFVETYTIEVSASKKIKSAKIHVTFVPSSFIKSPTTNRVTFDSMNQDDMIKTIVNTFAKKNIMLLKREEAKFTPLPTSMEEFNKYFVDEKDMINKELFMRRILGSVSYFVNDDPSLYPTSTVVKEEIPMSDYQYEKYANARREEKKLESRQKKNAMMDSVSVYKTYSRTVCNFVFPEGINRPKPKDIEVTNDATKKDDEYERQIQAALDQLNEKKSYLTTELSTYSPKFLRIAENVANSQGNVLIYSQFSRVEGIELISRVLEAQLGFQELKITRQGNNRWNVDFPPSGTPTYIKFKPDSMNLDDKARTEYTTIMLSIYNDDFNNLPENIRQQLKGRSNLRGDVLKVLFITQSGAEGISLKNVRQVHVTEPYWNKNRIDQVIGRANRMRSHVALPPNERNFTVYAYSMVFTPEQKANKKNSMIIMRNDKGETTDQNIYGIADRKHNIISAFLTAMKKAAVDCPLHNPEVGCFSFPVDVDVSSKAYTLNIADDTLDRVARQHATDMNHKVIKITIKNLGNRSFLYVTETNEIFDYALYTNTGVLNRVGYLKKLENGKYMVTLHANKE